MTDHLIQIPKIYCNGLCRCDLNNEQIIYGWISGAIMFYCDKCLVDNNIRILIRLKNLENNVQSTN